MTRCIWIVLILLYPIRAGTQTPVGPKISYDAPEGQWGFDVSYLSTNRILATAPFAEKDVGYAAVHEFQSDNWTSIWQQEGDSITSRYGLAVTASTDGKIFAIGAPYGLQPSVAVFQSVAGTYELLTQITDPSLSESEFGAAIALSEDGQFLAIGAPGHDDPRTDAGAVWFYLLEGTQWQLLGDPLMGSTRDGRFGSAIDLSADGSILAVGLPSTVEAGNTGKAKTYRRSSDDRWLLLGSSIVGSSDLTGSVLDLDQQGRRLVVGAPVGVGKATVYQFEDDDWHAIGEPLMVPGSSGAGYDVAISDDGGRVVCSGLGSNAQGLPGAVAVYDWNEVSFELTMTIEDQIGEAFGASIDLSPDGQTLLIGVPGNDQQGNNSGQVQVYRLERTTPVFEARQSMLTVYPNPVITRFTLSGIPQRAIHSIALVDPLGKVLLEATTTTIETDGLRPGYYHLVVKSRGGRLQSIPFVKAGNH